MSAFRLTPRDDALRQRRKRLHKARLLRRYWWPRYGVPAELREVA